MLECDVKITKISHTAIFILQKKMETFRGIDTTVPIDSAWWVSWREIIMPWMCVDHMIQQGVWLMGSSYLDPLAKSRPTGKIQTKSCFHQCLIYIHKFNKNHGIWLTGAWRRTPHCDPNRITLDLQSQVIRLGSQLAESFHTPINDTVFS